MIKLFPALILTLLLGCSAEQQGASRHQLAADNAAKGKLFLKSNAEQHGIVIQTSGLQYRVLKAGTGETATQQSNVTVHYRGTTVDGREFDSSYARGTPMIFQANRVIPGWAEALLLMKEGAKWQLFIPEYLAYGERGAGSAIGPRETLIFEVELLKVH